MRNRVPRGGYVLIMTALSLLEVSLTSADSSSFELHRPRLGHESQQVFLHRPTSRLVYFREETSPLQISEKITIRAGCNTIHRELASETPINDPEWCLVKNKQGVVTTRFPLETPKKSTVVRFGILSVDTSKLDNPSEQRLISELKTLAQTMRKPGGRK